MTFATEYLNRWRIEQMQCDVRTIDHLRTPMVRCPEQAKYVLLTQDDKTFRVCWRCLGTQVATLLRMSATVVVEALR